MLDRAFRFLFLLSDEKTPFFAKKPITSAGNIQLLRVRSCVAQNAGDHLETAGLGFLQSAHCLASKFVDRNS
jgi:hypothetical protein